MTLKLNGLWFGPLILSLWIIFSLGHLCCWTWQLFITDMLILGKVTYNSNSIFEHGKRRWYLWSLSVTFVTTQSNRSQNGLMKKERIISAIKIMETRHLQLKFFLMNTINLRKWQRYIWELLLIPWQTCPWLFITSECRNWVLIPGCCLLVTTCWPHYTLDSYIYYLISSWSYCLF